MLSKLFAPIICSWSDICRQLSAGKLTNQNWVDNKLNNNEVCLKVYYSCYVHASHQYSSFSYLWRRWCKFAPSLPARSGCQVSTSYLWPETQKKPGSNKTSEKVFTKPRAFNKPVIRWWSVESVGAYNSWRTSILVCRGTWGVCHHIRDNYAIGSPSYYVMRALR
jgi:hypothetical protein